MNLEYSNEEEVWRRPPSPKNERMSCQQIPKRSTTIAVVVLGLAILSCLLGYCVLSEPLPYDARTLKMVVILFRHGARTPTHTYNTDPYKNYKWQDGPGSLTNTGKMQLYELGRKFRAYYANFLPDEYFDRDVYITSSDHPRCLMSAYTLLAGLYPPGERQMWHPDINWQPIPVHAFPRELDKMIASKKPCKVADEMYKEHLEEVSNNTKYSELFDYLSKYTNQTMRNVVAVDYLYSTLKVEQENNLKIPEWTKNVFPDKMIVPTMMSLALQVYNETVKKLRAGPFLEDVHNHFIDVTRNPENARSLYLYSGHDVTIANIWVGLGLPGLVLPDYGASLTLELHEEIEQDLKYVKVFYWNNTKTDSPMELQLEWCEQPCPLDKFSTHITTYIPTDWEAECGN